MIQQFAYASRQGRVQEIPFSGHWSHLSVQVAISVDYKESSEECMRLFVPFGQRGTLSLEHLPGNDGTGVLAVNCEPALDTSLDPQLTLEIHHKGVTSIYAHSHAFVYLSGVVGLETVSLEAHSYLQAKTGEIYSHSLSVLMGEASHCTVRTIRVERLHLRQTCVSYFEVKKLHCSGRITADLTGSARTILRGTAARLVSLQDELSRIEADHLQVKQGECICFGYTHLSCCVRELLVYAALRGTRLTNRVPDAATFPIRKYAGAIPLRRLSVSDALAVAEHLKPGTKSRPTVFMLATFVNSRYSHCICVKGYRKSLVDGQPLLLDRYGRSTTPDMLAETVACAGTLFDMVYVEVTETAVDWSGIPAIQERYLRQEPVRFTYLFQA